MTTTPLTVLLEAGSRASYDVLGFRLERTLWGVAEAVVDAHFPGVIEPDELLGQPARLAFGRGGEEHALDGVVAEITLTASPQVDDDRGAVHRLRVTSVLDLLRHDVDSRIYQNVDVKEIVGDVLASMGIDAARQSYRLVAQYPKREVCVRYQESAFDFVSRLLEEEGILCHTESTDQGEVVVFEDDSTTCAPIDGDAHLAYRDAAGLAQGDDAVGHVTHRRRTATGKVSLRDYDFKKPKADLTATASADVDTDLEAYDYPGLYTDLAVGKRLAKVRLEALQTERAVVEIQSGCPRLLPGRSVSLDGTPNECDGEYLITSVVQELTRGVLRADATLIPKKVPFRIPQKTPRPVIHGPHTAVVMAPAGSPIEDVHTDEHGRCKVRFHWDRYGKPDDSASCWIRVAQLQTSGSMILPRVGWEVIVEFLEGNPDRPVVTGRVYNGRFMPPYALPEGKSRTALQSASSPGGKGRNEIRMEDKAGSEEMHVGSQKDTTLATANDKTVSTGVDASKNVKVDSTTTVGANQAVKVTSGYENTVAASQIVTVGGSRSVEVNAVYGLTSGGASVTSVGGTHFEMDGDPVQALLSLAAKAATDAAKAEAQQALQKLDQAVQAKVDQVMGPIHQIEQQAADVKAGMDAVSQGDLSGAKDAFQAAAGMPGPQKVAEDLGGGGGSAGGGSSGGMEAAATPAGGGGGGFSLDALAKGAVAKAGGAGDQALGTGGEDGGGSSEANAAGPDGAVSGNAAADGASGPGHSVNVCAATHAEHVGSIKATIAAGGIHTTVKGARTQSIGAAHVELVGGTRAETCMDAKTEKAVGLVVLSGGPESEQVGGSRATNVGGAILEKIGASSSVTAAGKAMFVGAFHKIDAATAIVFKCKSSEVVIDGSGITIKSTLVTISAPTVTLKRTTSEA